jgi:hypothetical protein
MPAEQFSEKISELTDLRTTLTELDCVVRLDLEIGDKSELIHGVAHLSHVESSFLKFNEVVNDYSLEIGSIEPLDVSGENQQRVAVTSVAFSEEW